MAELSGVLLVDKPQGMTSHDVVGRVRKLYNTKRVGHTGTLDPLATGLLVVLIGRAAKAAEYLVLDNKCYLAGIRLGITSDTEDITGEVLSRSVKTVSNEEFIEAANSFVGDIMQTPPMYSALKVDGVKLVDLARKNIVIERESRPITIYSIDSTRIDENEYSMRVDCSKGTYIRTLCADIGEKLGCGAVMSSLRRERSGTFSLDDAYTLETLENMSEDERAGVLIPTESLFYGLEAVKLPEFYERLCRNGAEIYQKKIKTDYKVGTRVRIYGKDGFFALGEVMEYDDGSAVKAIKLFDLA
ncbi:MAG: tRNA pseudouridine(55) synthase TruB [Clostridia bacterium]|nr:tRNA pseudouridine(55) synthase TruB [Clostridia bacterium]